MLKPREINVSRGPGDRGETVFRAVRIMYTVHLLIALIRHHPKMWALVLTVVRLGVLDILRQNKLWT